MGKKRKKMYNVDEDDFYNPPTVVRKPYKNSVRFDSPHQTHGVPKVKKKKWILADPPFDSEEVDRIFTEIFEP